MITCTAVALVVIATGSPPEHRMCFDTMAACNAMLHDARRAQMTMDNKRVRVIDGHTLVQEPPRLVQCLDLTR